MKSKIFYFTIVLSSFSFYTFSQGGEGHLFSKDGINRNEASLDIANILTFLTKKPDSYLVNYKRHFVKKFTALRFGLNIDYGTAKLRGFSLNTRLGYEWQYNTGRWKIYRGMDFIYGFTNYNYQKNTYTKFGISPLFGVQYKLNEMFSISTETKLNLLYHIYRNPESFDPDANKEDFEIILGSVGMVLINFHF